jgi:Flp pilus assembly pilin Flp
MREEAQMRKRVRNFWDEQDGQDLIEYSLLITFIAIAVMFVMGSTRPAVNSIWQSTNSDLSQGLAAASGS